MSENVKAEVKGKTLTITVDLGRDLGPSKSGKTNMIATTKGNMEVPGTDGVKIGLNVYRSAKEGKK
jgi:predicted acyl esterase